MDILRWGLIGCGDIATRCVGPALAALTTCELTAVSRKNASKLDDGVERLGAKTGYADWHTLLLDDRIDAVYIATPVNQHEDQTIRAAESGRHVLCEKPMAMTTAQCRKMIDACDRNGVRLGVAYYRRFYPVVARMKAIIAAGDIGDVMLVQVDAYETPVFSPDHPRYWLFQKDRAGGGVMMDFGCHRIDLLLNLMGRITEVKGMTGRVYPDHEVEDVATALFKFENNACGMLTVMRGGTTERDTVYIQGTKGSIRVDTLNAGNLCLKTGAGEHWTCLPKEENGHLPLIASFVHAVFHNHPPEVDGTVGLDVQKAIEAACGI